MKLFVSLSLSNRFFYKSLFSLNQKSSPCGLIIKGGSSEILMMVSKFVRKSLLLTH